MNTLSEFYNSNKEKFYFQVLLFFISLGIAVASIAYSVNANTISQYGDGELKLFNPFEILEFSNDQLKLDDKPTPITINIDSFNSETSHHESKKKLHFVFFIDRTISIKQEENSNQKEFRDELISQISKLHNISKFSVPTENALLEMPVTDLLCLYSILETVFQNRNNDIYISIAYYYGDSKEKDFKYLYLTDPQNQGKSQPGQYCYLLKSTDDESLRIRNIVSSFVTDYNREKETYKNKTNLRTDFEFVLDKLNSNNLRKDSTTKILSIISDFAHEENLFVNGKPTENIPFEKVLAKAKEIFKSELYQLNLLKFRYSYPDLSAQKNIPRLIQTLKLQCSRTFYYRINSTELLSKISQVNTRVKEILTPVEKEQEKITFYYPYELKNKSTNGIKALVNLNRSNDVKITLRSDGMNLPGAPIRLNMCIKDEHEICQSNRNFFLDESEIIPAGNNSFDMQFQNQRQAGNFEDLFFDIYDANNLKKLRIPIVFKEKISRFNAILLADSVLLIILCYFLYCTLFIGNWLLRYHKVFKLKHYLWELFALSVLLSFCFIAFNLNMNQDCYIIAQILGFFVLLEIGNQFINTDFLDDSSLRSNEDIKKVNKNLFWTILFGGVIIFLFNIASIFFCHYLFINMMKKADLIPFCAIIFSITIAFGVHNYIELRKPLIQGEEGT